MDKLTTGERERFEAWADDGTKMMNGMERDFAWDAWQARAGERVPREPTPEQLMAGIAAWFEDNATPTVDDPDFMRRMRAAAIAMYDAAPIAQPAEPPRDTVRLERCTDADGMPTVREAEPVAQPVARSGHLAMCPNCGFEASCETCKLYGPPRHPVDRPQEQNHD